ncbi:MAG: hypothetical protein A2017_14275 [Lentisphaerae bacterium GWF2_44_16]|nr:MAG: hypothetical protein A2017_14275 [Lentisphaerae bacterium GWF2_44_16]
MKTIGGEMELGQENIFSCVTDSGRSSLKLIVRGLPKKMKYALPDFICSSVVDVFRKSHSDFSFYKVNEDFSIDRESLRRIKFDVFYSVNYFGQKNNYLSTIRKNKILLEDSVFLPELKRPEYTGDWIAFNSFRKISPLADGSIINSTIELRENLIKKDAAPFSGLKYKAKNIKYEYIHSKGHSEKKYLELFEEAEKKLDAQETIYGISGTSLFNLLDFYKNLKDENAVRKGNFEILNKKLKSMRIEINPEFPSFFPLKVNRRNELRKYLFSKKIFLPVHWPAPVWLKNGLYEKIISIPVDSRYTAGDMSGIVAAIKAFYE